MIEHEGHGHHHGTGIPWLDLVLAGAAILISVISLVVSVRHGRTMERLVEANEKQVKAATLPILRFDTGNFDIAKELPAVHFDVSNGGTGPAVIEWFTLEYKGAEIAGPADLASKCCGLTKGSHLLQYIQNSASGQTLSAGQSLVVYYMPVKGNDAELMKRLATTEQFSVTAKGCYCSVLDECWVTDFAETRPREVKGCEAERPKTRW
ncbi:MAG: hypothetical protein NVS9B15_10590 [Acidobacteriaceae bacterium]